MIQSLNYTPLNDYAAMLSNINDPLRQNGFKRWLFFPGMAFGATQKWWGDFGTRDFPHEGVDFCLYEGTDACVFEFAVNSAIPVVEDGVVRAVFRDYLGQAIVVEHGQWFDSNKKLLSIYAHTDPSPHIQSGVRLRKEEVIATTADTRSAKAKILSHLHFTLGLVSPNLSYDDFYWNLFRDPENVTLLDPLEVVPLPYHQPRAKIPERFINKSESLVRF